eukprot:scaffold7011_cov112-Isochrysis_galbana.AAC.8
MAGPPRRLGRSGVATPPLRGRAHSRLKPASFASVEGGANRQERPSEATVKPLKDPYSKWDKNTFTALLGNVETINGAKTPPDHWPVPEQVRAVLDVSYGAHPQLPSYRSCGWEVQGARNECPRRRGGGEYKEPHPARGTR